MANKNFEIKNGLTIAGTERISSSGAFTGSLASTTTATTQSSSDNSTKIATTAYTDAAITAVIGGAPGTLDTLNELAAAINDDASYASTLTTALATKLPLAGGTVTGVTTFTGGDGVVVQTASDTFLQLKTTGSGSNYIEFKDSGGSSGNIRYNHLTNILSVKTNGTDNRLVIDASGNVGIGLPNPSEKLEISGKIKLGGMRLASNDSGRIGLNRNPDDGSTTDSNLQRFQINGPYTGGDYLDFQSYNSSGTYTGSFYLNAGKVGINDNNPSQMLSVSGTGSVPPARFTATGNTNTLEVFGNATASTSTGLLCNAGTNEFDYSAKFRNYAGSTIMEVRGDSVIDIFGTTRLQDNTILALGQSSDARIYYDGTDSLYITASNGTANTVNITANNFQIGGATPLISGTANDSVVINQDGASNVDFRVESDNEQYNFFCDASTEIIHFGEGTNSDTQSVTPARTLSGRRHGYHGGNKQHTGQTFKYSEGTSWTDAIKIDWHNVSWGAVCMRITGQYYYGASNNFSVVIGFSGYGEVNNSSYGHNAVSYDATSSGVETWTNAIQLAQTATGETTIRQRAGDGTGDIIYRYEWQCYARSNQPILIIDL